MDFKSFIKGLFISPYNLLRKYKESKRIVPALSVVLLSYLSVIVYVPFLSAAKGSSVFLNMLSLLLSVLLGYAAACGAFWLSGAILKKKVSFAEVSSTWGFSYLPTFLAFMAILLGHIILPKGVLIFGNTPSAVGFLSLLIMMFIWKVLFYFMELRVVLRLNFAGTIAASVIIGIFFIAFYIFSAYVFGLKIPIV